MLYELASTRNGAVTFQKCYSSSEMDHYLKYSASSRRMRKKFKNYEPYWSEDLNIKWLNMSKSKNYTKCNGSRQLKSA